MARDQLDYGRIEWERRFLLRRAPDGLDPRSAVAILDRYLIGTRLRLRRMESPDGLVRHKLAKKLARGERGGVVMGNLYLTAEEHAALAGVAAHEVRKRRHALGSWSVDVFAGALQGLVLAEIEAESREALAREAPPFAVEAEVTDDERFTGGRLAATSATELQALLRERLG
jgi:CYTH domain-containing protein